MSGVKGLVRSPAGAVKRGSQAVRPRRGNVKLTYPSRTLRLLGVEPRLSPRAVAAVERTEALRGMRLPAAVRELYTLDGVARAPTSMPPWISRPSRRSGWAACPAASA